ncbi:hypothetical protein AGQ46_24685, partial [Salmonella enterica subsp. enterica]
MGAFALGYIALNRGEQLNVLWIVVATVSVYLIAYRFYGPYIAKKALAVGPTGVAPPERHNDGLGFVPPGTKGLVGDPFGAIAGAGSPGVAGPAGGSGGLSGW